MTREEAIIEAGIEYSIQNNPYCIGGDNFYEKARELNRNKSFEAGAIWADKNPKSPWISVKEDLPCNHEELMEPICQLDNRLIYETKRVFVHCSNNSLDTAHMINFYNRWKWYPEDIDVEHWFPIPELPKKQEIKL